MIANDRESLQRFVALDPRGEPLDLLTARDRAYSRYGEVAHFVHGDARCTASVSPRARDAEGVPMGLIGDFALPDDAEAADAVIWPALEWLRERGCRRVQGPISRHTWYPFRVVTEGFDAAPPFGGEPWNAPWLLARLESAGFLPVAWYVSAWTPDLQRQLDQSAGKIRSLEARGYTLRPLDPARLADDLAEVHGLTLRSFSPPNNHLFHPIDFDEFRLVLAGGGQGVDPDLVRLCIGPDGDTAGYVYNTVEACGLGVIKTLAVAPEHAGAGIGGALVALSHAICAERGVSRIVHAILRVGSASVRISSAGAEAVLRRYAVLERAL